MPDGRSGSSARRSRAAAPSRRLRTSRANRSASSLRQRRGERHHDHLVGPDLAGKLDPAGQRGQLGRRQLGAEHLDRVRMKGQTADRRPRACGRPIGRLDHARWPRWTPSKVPIASDAAPAAPGRGSCRCRSCEHHDRVQPAVARLGHRHQLAVACAAARVAAGRPRRRRWRGRARPARARRQSARGRAGGRAPRAAFETTAQRSAVICSGVPAASTLHGPTQCGAARGSSAPAPVASPMSAAIWRT